MSNKGSFTRVANNIKRIKENAHRELKASFAITYTAPYAARIHEDLEMVHTNGQAKYLEQPIKEHASTMSRMIKDLIQKEGQSLRTALLIVANWLLEESKKLVPVDTGNLRDSGVVKIVHG